MNFSLQAPPASDAPLAPIRDLPSLPQSRPARRSRWGRNLLLIGGLLGAVAVAAVLLGLPIPGLGRVATLTGLLASDRATVLTYKVKRGTLPVTLTERGNLESSNNKDVYNEVEGTTTIIMILPEGTRVKKGELVCELDSATLRDNLDTQQIATESAKAQYENAEKTHEVALIAVKEYEEGTYKQELESAMSSIVLAKSDLERLRESYEWAQKMYGYGYVSNAKLNQERLNLQKGEISLREAETRKMVLEKFTYNKTITELKAEVEKTLSDKLSKETTLNLERQKEEKLRRLIEKCKMYAPDDGLVVYANEQNNMRGGGNTPQIEEGATVRERQKIFSLPDIGNMQVNTKVHEAMIDRVKRGQRARIRVEAQPGEPLTGVVKSVAPLPDASSFFSSDVKVYTTIVTIDNSPPSLRPGMTAQVEILIEQLEDVLAVPTQAILSFEGKDHIFVRRADGGWDRRVVKLGTTNDKLVEVKEGIQEGDEVALSPLSLMSEEEKQRVFSTASSSGAGKTWSQSDAAKSKQAGEAANDAKGGEEKAKAKRKGGGGFNPAMFQKFQNLTPEDREALKSASEEERKAIMKKAGFTDDEIQQMTEMRRNMPPGGFGGGGGVGGGGGSAPGGPGGGERP